MPREIELKFRVEDENDMIRRLGTIGAEKTNEGLEHNIVFDSDDRTFREQGFLLRLRKFAGRNTLTFKRAVTKKDFKEAEEIQTGVENFGNMKEILLRIGFDVSWVYEKETTHFALGDILICIDKLPFGTFMEIEGTKEGIISTAKKLGLDPAEGITETYMELYEQYCKERGQEVENLVFWKKAR